MAATDIDAPLRKGERVIAVTDLRGVPEGTSGKIMVVNGIDWIRYWVMFDNGIDLGTIDGGKLVRAKHWKKYQLERAEREARAAEAAERGETLTEAPSAESAAVTGGDQAVVNGVTVPQLLLERSRKARERLGA